MNHFSFEQDQEPRELHCLQQEIGEHEIDTWMGNSQERAEEDVELDGCILSNFDLNIPSFQDIPFSNIKQNKVCQQICQVLDEQNSLIIEESHQNIQQQSRLSTSQQKSQGGSTFYEQQSISTTLVQGSQEEEEKWQKESGKALNQFITLSESTYRPMMGNFKQMLTEIKNYSDKTMENLNMYYLFFSIKLEQQTQRYRIIKAQREGIQEIVKRSILLEGVYLDEKVVIQQMLDHDRARIDVLTNFCQSVEQSCSKLKSLLSKSVEFRTKKIEHVLSYLEKTEIIHAQLVQFILNPPSLAQSSSWIGKPDIRCDRYLQRKYLQERERIFLSQLKTLGEKTIGLLHSIFIKEQPLICAMISKEIERYYRLNNEVYGRVLDYRQQTKVDISEVNEDLKKVLASIIPVEWKMFINIDMSHIEEIINQIHEYVQNHIFLPTVTIEENLVISKQKARWVCKTESSPNKKHNKKAGSSSHSKENELEGANQPTYAALITQRYSKAPITKTKGLEVVAILTADKYLHLESGEKIACLKLKRLKLKRKGQRSIVVNQNTRSITNLFSSSLYLGQIIFATQQMADDFAKAVLSTSK